MPLDYYYLGEVRFKGMHFLLPLSINHHFDPENCRESEGFNNFFAVSDEK